MKVLKTYQRTFECIGFVKHTDLSESSAFVSFIDGNLTVLRLETTGETFNLYLEADQKRLAKSDIIEVHFEVPAYVKLRKQADIKKWR